MDFRSQGAKNSASLASLAAPTFAVGVAYIRNSLLAVQVMLLVLLLLATRLARWIYWIKRTSSGSNVYGGSNTLTFTVSSPTFAIAPYTAAGTL